MFKEFRYMLFYIACGFIISQCICQQQIDNKNKEIKLLKNELHKQYEMINEYQDRFGEI